MNNLYKALGLMSGTSLDGIDVAYLETDGLSYVKPIHFGYYPYDDKLRQDIRECFGARTKTPNVINTERDVTLAHIFAIQSFMAEYGLSKNDIDLIGFHGQTITYDPDHKFTWQIGDGEFLAREVGVRVVYDFRTADVAAGGLGAPLIPIYHWARAFSSNIAFPAAILNIGGVSNVTWLGQNEGDILAFDCGPGNALIDDMILRATGERFDKDGVVAKSGKVDQEIVSRWMSHPFFTKLPPKALDRNAWDVSTISNFPVADAVATLTDFTVSSIANGKRFFPEPVTSLFVTGGGRLNHAIMDGLRTHFASVHKVEDLGWNGDVLEAEGFAYLAVRRLLALPISFPKTTGCPAPMSGGKVCEPR